MLRGDRFDPEAVSVGSRAEPLSPSASLPHLGGGGGGGGS